MDEFIFDARDHLTTAGTQLLELERQPGSLDDLNSLMGTLHTIKGNSGFVNLRGLYGMLHGAENLLQTVRDAPGHVCPPAIINQLFQVLDAVEALLSRLEAGEGEEVDWLPALNQAIAEAEASLGRPEAQPALAGSPALPEASPGQASPDVPPAGAAGPSPAGPPAEGDWVLGLADGQLAAEGPDCLSFLESGRGFLLLDVGALTSLGFGEMRTIRDLALLDGDRVVLVPDREGQPDFWRALEVWSLDNKVRAFRDRAQALAGLGNR
jgi:HPt (histidine-containing phosphotransfer) domain-containing protein